MSPTMTKFTEDFCIAKWEKLMKDLYYISIHPSFFCQLFKSPQLLHLLYNCCGTQL